MSRLRILRKNFASRRFESEDVCGVGGGGLGGGGGTLRHKVTVMAADYFLSKLTVLILIPILILFSYSFYLIACLMVYLYKNMY